MPSNLTISTNVTFSDADGFYYDATVDASMDLPSPFSPHDKIKFVADSIIDVHHRLAIEAETAMRLRRQARND